MVKEKLKLSEGLFLNFVFLPVMLMALAIGVAGVMLGIFGEHKNPCDYIGLTAGPVLAASVIFAAYDMFYRYSVLTIDQIGIRLRRKEYTYHICYNNVENILMYKSKDGICWLFVLQSDGMVRPIELNFSKYNWQDVEDTLIDLAHKNNFVSLITDKEETVNSFLSHAAGPPNEMTYKVKSGKVIHLLFCIGGFLFIFFLFVSALIIFVKEPSIGTFLALFVFGGLSLVGLAYGYHELNRNDYSIVLNTSNLIIEGKAFKWNNFMGIYAKYISKSTLEIYVDVFDNESLEVETFNRYELAEQFTLFAGKLVCVVGLED
ncbi:MAG: hypothetical protein J5875_05355 [Paludibacteraceae bacterium]|nr:hypothetical protein [Paludibacteraceae bacterium]